MFGSDYACCLNFTMLCIVTQWLCVPFAMTHEAVGSFSATKDRWLGSLDLADAAMFTDIYLLLIFGGIPWQVRHQRSGTRVIDGQAHASLTVRHMRH